MIPNILLPNSPSLVRRVPVTAWLATALLLLAPGLASAGNIYVVHAIPGTDLGLAEDTLAVDVRVGEDCLLPGVEFGQSASTEAPVGSYDVEISLSDGACGGALAITGGFDVSLFQTVVVVAHLDKSGAPTLSAFPVDATPVQDGDVRLTFFHGAAAPDVLLRGRVAGSRDGKIRINRLGNGVSSFATEARAGELDADIRDADRYRRVLKVRDVPVAGNLAIVAAGTASTLQPVVVPIVDSE